MNVMLSRCILGALPEVKPHGFGGKMPPGLCGDGVEASYCGRDYEGVETAYGGAQSRSKAVWGWMSGGVEHVALCARINHVAGNLIIQTDVSNVFNSVFRKPMLEQVTACTPALTGFVAKCYGERPASVFFQMDSGERTKLECSRGV